MDFSPTPCQLSYCQLSIQNLYGTQICNISDRNIHTRFRFVNPLNPPAAGDQRYPIPRRVSLFRECLPPWRWCSVDNVKKSRPGIGKFFKLRFMLIVYLNYNALFIMNFRPFYFASGQPVKNNDGNPQKMPYLYTNTCNE